MATVYSGSDAGKSGLELVELDGSPDVKGVTKINVSNTTLTDDGNGVVTLVTGGGGGGSGTVTSITVSDGTFVDLTATPDPITTTGSITADLSATGTADATTFLRGDNTWATPAGGSGTVTSVDVSGGTTGLTYSGGPITTSGTITMAGTLAVANGGTGATTTTNARQNLGIYSGLEAGITINNGRNQYSIDIQTAFGSILTANSVIQITLESGGVIVGDTLLCWMDNYDPTPGSNAITVVVDATVTSPPGPYTGNIHYTIIA